MEKRILQREQAVERITRHVLASGLAKTSLRQLAHAAGISDRMLLYYFENKDDVLTAVMGRVAFELAGHLEAALPAGERLPPAQLLERGAALTTGDAVAPYMKLSMEIVAAAGRGEAPYAQIASGIIGGFLAWVEARLETPDETRRRAQAAMILTVIDGLAVLSTGLEKHDLDAAVSVAIAALKGKE